MLYAKWVYSWMIRLVSEQQRVQVCCRLSSPKDHMLLNHMLWFPTPNLGQDAADSTTVLFLGLRIINPVETVIKMLEEHTQKLEELVHKRSELLYEEKQKAEGLLYSVLPV